MTEQPLSDDVRCSECGENAEVSIRYHGDVWAYCLRCRREAVAAWQQTQEGQTEQRLTHYYGSSRPVTVQEQYDAAVQQKREWRR